MASGLGGRALRCLRPLLLPAVPLAMRILFTGDVRATSVRVESRPPVSSRNTPLVHAYVRSTVLALRMRVTRMSPTSRRARRPGSVGRRMKAGVLRVRSPSFPVRSLQAARRHSRHRRLHSRHRLQPGSSFLRTRLRLPPHLVLLGGNVLPTARLRFRPL